MPTLMQYYYLLEEHEAPVDLLPVSYVLHHISVIPAPTHGFKVLYVIYCEVRCSVTQLVCSSMMLIIMVPAIISFVTL